jgi:hypothetical protein
MQTPFPAMKSQNLQVTALEFLVVVFCRDPEFSQIDEKPRDFVCASQLGLRGFKL